MLRLRGRSVKAAAVSPAQRAGLNLFGMGYEGSRGRGFALVEVLVAVAILGIVISTSLAIFFDRQKRLMRAAETIAAYQAIANEAEVHRRLEFTSIDSRDSFISLVDEKGDPDPGALGSLKNVTTSVRVERPNEVIKEITLVVEWGEGTNRRTARMTVLRSFAGNQGQLGAL